MKINRQNCTPCRMLLTLVCAMLLAGCGGLQAPKVEKPNLYVLDARASARAVQIKRDLVLAVSMPRARSGFDTPQMVYLRQPQKLEYFAVNRWANAPARMLGPLLVQALEQTGGFRAVVQSPGTIPANIRLDTELIRLQQDFGARPSKVQLTLRAQLIDVADQRVLAVKLFDEVEDAVSDDAYGGSAAANRVLQRVLDQLADFCINESASH
ncbi:MAG: ABC-type transport auxiliary lipoprotein family protein [Sulfuricaulis sp.]|nr:ABC-type transport auxiliary lipoprotein family protein [Sulfuricaulis sp.]